jgi:hypothetical protein
MKFLNSAASLLDGCHLNEREALGRCVYLWQTTSAFELDLHR